MIGEVVSHFRIIEELGRGGMGVVYRAEDLRLGRTVAIKFLQDALSSDPASIARFEREARAASSLNHPHICAVHDVGLRDGRPFIVMELLEGTSLHQSVAAAPLPLEQVVERGLEIADALEAAHARGLIHRDIKPANVFITTRGEAKLLDFGLATSGGGPAVSAAEASTLQPLTNPGTVLGTLAYMSPEQVRGEPLDARSDLFSLGAVLYEAATGRRPFAGNTAGTIHDAILNRAPLPACRVNSELPPRLEEILQKALEKDRSLRYQSASDLAADLLRLKRDILSDRAPGTAASGQRHGLQGSARRTRLLLAIPAGVALVAAALFFWLNTPGDAIDSIAVLPFSNVSGNPDTEYLSDGLTESLINNLSQLRTLRVIARGTVFRYKGHDRDPLAIGRDLGVRAVLTGRLLQREDRLVVRTELVDVSNGAQLWGQEYNRPSDDIITLQAQLAGEISERLRLQLSKEEQRQLTKRDTDDPVAYELYLKGRYHWNSRDVRAMGVAIGYFNQAIARDPRFALAYAGLADAYNLSSFFNASPPGDVMPRARAAASRALEIDEHLAEAHISIAYVSFTYDWDWAAATRHFERARELSPSVVDAHAYYPFYLTVGRRPAEAIAAAQRVLGTDPLSFTRIHNLAVQLLLAGKYDAAIEECRRAVTLEGVAAVTYEVMANAYGAKGQYREALAAAEQANRLNPGNAMMLALVGYVRASMGQRLEGHQILAQLTALQRQRYIPPLAFALVHAGLDDRDQAFIWLERAFEERANRLAYLPFEPTWERLRSDPRFSDLVRRIGLPR